MQNRTLISFPKANRIEVHPKTSGLKPGPTDHNVKNPNFKSPSISFIK